MSTPIYQVDAFSREAFGGNPAAVCILESSRDAAWMQSVAEENNLAETAFVERREDGFGLRWFTPLVEVALCGHATLASAHVLWTEGDVPDDQPIRFHTLSGVLTATRRDFAIELDFPSQDASPADPAPGLLEALGIASPVYVGRNQFDYLVQVESATKLRDLAPDFARLRNIETRGVIVTAESDSTKFDFLSRFFAPAAGIDEDPVTGSAHCCLAPYWQERLGKSELTGFQASPRGGIVGVRVAGERTFLAGEACTVIKGELVC